ncbi:hypothetical protein EK21DRAFT_112502 [Setomelanomma holmii]|uniref:SnoaL-like domain-containing protein n=1 Tax=Setomelanomma holmii TaxID=210430 RepID=A0A9P4H8V8_9PLEO|nr:hypothetical protein EK21DRAFT_112502 [Setomelanomma holmii]
MATPVALPTLSTREAVADALYRCVLGIDNNDRALFESACLKDESMLVVAGPFKIEGWTAINDFFARLFDLITTHITSNIRVELKDNADTAYMTCHALSYHVKPDDALKPEDTSYTASSLYFIDLVKDSSD